MTKSSLKIESIVVCITCFYLFACGGGGSGDTSENSQSRVAQNYVTEVLTIMRNNALTRNEVDWGNLESEVNQLAVNATSISETYPAITRALELINTNHSFLLSSSGNLITYPSTLNCTETFDMDASAQTDIGYVRVDGFSSRDSQSEIDFATNVQQQIAQQDSASVIAWIVDLRNNTGGNMWPMIAGLGPLFDVERLGYFIDPDETSTSWGYRAGASYLGSSNLVQVSEPYTIINPLPKIAVLTSKRVGSSGEAVVIAFKKQFNVRFFGSNTCGLSTANTSFSLSDGSELFLTTAVMADRDQERYGGPVLVDEVLTPESVIENAITWLRE